ncbi:hypothetical protein [Methylobacillus sp.]|uniref:hypothetical protein n=1 Tax=Methylobacillus sp. TaxID=56818 RepID=UPI002FDF86D7
MSAAKYQRYWQRPSDDKVEKLLSTWEHAIRQGNEAYTENRTQLALQQYQLALRQAKLLLREYVQAKAGEKPSHGRFSVDQILAAYVVSHHNLADAHIRQGDVHTAACRLCEVHRCLSCICSDPAFHGELRDAAQRHGRHTYHALLTFNRLYQQVSPLVEKTLHACGQFCALQTQTMH